MKKIITVFFLTCTLNSFSQDTTQIEQYCEVISTTRFLSSKMDIYINYGEVRSVWKDNSLKDEDGKIKKFNSTIDALNFLGKLGWKLINMFPDPIANGIIYYHYFFKKEFSKSEAE